MCKSGVSDTENRASSTCHLRRKLSARRALSSGPIRCRHGSDSLCCPVTSAVATSAWDLQGRVRFQQTTEQRLRSSLDHPMLSSRQSKPTRSCRQGTPAGKILHKEGADTIASTGQHSREGIGTMRHR